MFNPFKKTKQEETPVESVEVRNENATDKEQERNQELWQRYWSLKDQKAEMQKNLDAIEEELLHRANKGDLWEGKTAHFSSNKIRKTTREVLKFTKEFDMSEFFEEDDRFERYSKTVVDEKQVLTDAKDKKLILSRFGMEIKESESFQFVKS